MPDPELVARTRDMISKLLLSPTNDQTTPEGLFRVAEELAQRAGWRFDWPAGVEYWWDLARVGAIALLGGGASGYSYAQAPMFVVTEHGRRLLRAEESSPHDSTRYMRALKRRVAVPDTIALSYIEEGIAAWRAGLHRSSVVMVGCACERLIILLAESVAAASIPPYSADPAKRVGGPSVAGGSERAAVST